MPVMNPFLLIGAILLAGNLLFFQLWQSAKEELIAYSAGAAAVAKQAQEDKAAAEKAGQDNIAQLKDRYEKDIPKIRADAVAAYRAAHRVPVASGGQSLVPGTAAGLKTHDGARQEPLATPSCPADEQLVSDAAEDANTLTEWQEWAIRNRVPIE